MFSRSLSVLAALGLVAPSIPLEHKTPTLAKANNISAIALDGGSDGWPPYGPQPPQPPSLIALHGDSDGWPPWTPQPPKPPMPLW
jgi:hypothetical protein